MLTFFLSLLDNDADRARFAWIYDRYHQQMEQRAMSILDRQCDAEDAAQNAFLQVIKHFEKIYEIPCEELPFWLISIVKNEALTILRKKHRAVPLEDWDGVVQATDGVSSYQDLVSLFTQLPETYRAVLEMKLLWGYTDREIARHLNISETAVSTRASRGRELLRKLAKKEGICP